MASIILFKDRMRVGPVSIRRVRHHTANDNIRCMEFEVAGQDRNWCSLAIFSLLLFVAAISIASSFFSIFSV